MAVRGAAKQKLPVIKQCIVAARDRTFAVLSRRRHRKYLQARDIRGAVRRHAMLPSVDLETSDLNEWRIRNRTERSFALASRPPNPKYLERCGIRRMTECMLLFPSIAMSIYAADEDA